MGYNLAFDFGRNSSTFGEFIGYLDLTDFRQISPKHSRNKDKRKCVGKFEIFDIRDICPVVLASIYVTRLAYF